MAWNVKYFFVFFSTAVGFTCLLLFMFLTIQVPADKTFLKPRFLEHTVTTTPLRTTVRDKKVVSEKQVHQSHQSSDVNNLDISLDSLIKIAKYLQKAKIHSRGFKTRDNLQLAISELDQLLKKHGNNFKETTERKSKNNSESVCPEQYTDPDYGFPLFEVGFIETNCTYQKPLESLITIVIVYDQNWTKNISDILRQIHDFSSKINVLLSVPDSLMSTVKLDSVSNIKISTRLNTTPGKSYNNLISQVNTPFTLVAPFIHIFHKDARLHRLIREIELLNLDIAGGSFRNSSGIWNMGCHQRMEYNYTLVYREGYDESFHDCVFCDHIEGPFVAKTKLLKKITFNEKLSMVGLFEDFFLRISGEIAICPDSMFYVHKQQKSEHPDSWLHFARLRNLIKLSWAENVNIEFDCNYKFPCSAKAGYIIHPCCVNDLKGLTNTILEACENEGMFCEPHGGTILGPIKMRHTLPWERDSDIRVLHNNFSEFFNKESIFTSKQLKITYRKKNFRICPSIPGGSMNINSKHWKADVYPYCNVSSVEALKLGLTPTKIWHQNTLISVPRNPGLAARNRYPGLYKHAEHCSVLGISALSVYKKHGFKTCSEKSQCLSRLNPDGNLQFFIGVLP